jgi:hypothetical protein
VPEAFKQHLEQPFVAAGPSSIQRIAGEKYSVKRTSLGGKPLAEPCQGQIEHLLAGGLPNARDLRLDVVPPERRSGHADVGVGHMQEEGLRSQGNLARKRSSPVRRGARVQEAP